MHAKTLDAWKMKYYKKPADEVRGKMAALRHSLNKWTGLLPEVLKKYGLTREDYERDIKDYDGERLQISTDTCALCCLYLGSDNDCNNCPLFMVKGDKCDNGSRSPFTIWLRTGDPQPMIDLIQAAIQSLKENKQ